MSPSEDPFIEQTTSDRLSQQPHLRPMDLLNARWDTLLAPLFATAVSGVLLFAHVVMRSWRLSRRAALKDERVQPVVSSEEARFGAPKKDEVKQPSPVQGERVIRLFQISRLLGSFTLFSLSLAILFLQGGHRKHISWSAILSPESMHSISVVIIFLYTSILAAVCLLKRSWTRVLTRHVNSVLLVAFAVYLYRDIWPLATYNLKPIDLSEGVFLWVKVAVLTFTAVVIPLFIPRQYVPVDPKHPMETINPEQTASIFSMMFYTFMDPVVFKAYRLPHLSHTELPPLADRDRSEHLTKTIFPRIDIYQGARKRHLFFSFISVFRWQYVGMALAITSGSFASFAPPVAVNRILTYLETDGREASVTPWLWVLCLFLGPVTTAVSLQWYMFLGSKTLTRAESLLTQLIFDHSLRIRFKAEASGDDAPAVENNTTQIGTPETNVPPQKPEKKKSNLVGKINTLMTVDMDHIVGSRDFFLLILLVPIKMTLALVFLYIVLGWSAFVGFTSIIILLPVPGYIATRMQNIQRKKMGKTDARVEAVSETVSILRMVKLFGWEQKMSRSLEERRNEELAWVWKGKVSLDRVGNFLQESELLDSFDHEINPETPPSMSHRDEDVIGFNNAVFAWSKEHEDGTQTPSSRTFRLRTEGSISFKRNCINLIIGPTGAGKTSILMALLGEMHFIPTKPDSWYNLPRQNGIAYAAQESWVQNETIRDNILFGSPYSEERYQKVIYQCGLKQDLELFEAGDMSEVGERGLTLSGGQKARVTLARAIYSSAEIILLDDVLAALDVHTSKWIVNECLKGDLVRDRTVLLVTHNIALTGAIADHIVSIGLDGIAHDEGSDISAALAHDPTLASELKREKEEMEVETQVVDAMDKEGEKPDGKLILAEEIAEGRVSWPAIAMFVKGLGGDHPILFLGTWLVGLVLWNSSNMFSVWFLGYWGTQYESHAPEEVRVSYYLGLYCLILTGAILAFSTATVIFQYGTQRASRRISGQLVDSILGSTLRWLDETPTSRILVRCTQDIENLDTYLASNFGSVVSAVMTMSIKLAGPVLFTPIFLVPGVVMGVLGAYVGNIYVRAQMSVTREGNNARAPLLAHFGAAIAGLISIRAYGAQQSFKAESLKRIDHFANLSRSEYNLSRWIGVRTDLLGATFTTAVASYLLVRRSLSSANTGFSLNMSIEFTSMILWLVSCFNNFEVDANSLERIKAYIDIDHEPESTEAGRPPAAWPKSGDLRVEGLSARYSATGPKVLHGISFRVKSGERIGIVGRTGSGKSSLTLALLRCILTEGTVYYDGLPTDKVNLDALRSNITIIPQMPELLSGTLRRNLDPFTQNDDATLNDALRAAGLFILQTELDEVRFTLDSEIASGGKNLSVGQRQIIALARAIVRRSKLLILDEATSAIDHKTDAVIQATLRNELGADVTILTVAHRLQTIMDADKIMVLDSGRIVEFDAPLELLKRKGGAFKSMVDSSGDKKALYAMAERK
ncbi:hypothetical protein B0H34DRAFT_797400 [Crassisporium funariophilum]|nr:hypothetical protein B0H34DRAFT_797400 [Crassisporium funariophilum]